MKKSTLTLVAFLLISNLSFEHNGDPKTATTPNKVAPEVVPEVGVSLKDIFLSDYEGVTLFIDFQAIKDDVISLNVIQNNKVILNDDVHNLSTDIIYELDLAKLQAGNYLVELKTAQGIAIQKELTVK